MRVFKSQVGLKRNKSLQGVLVTLHLHLRLALPLEAPRPSYVAAHVERVASIVQMWQKPEHAPSIRGWRLLVALKRVDDESFADVRTGELAPDALLRSLQPADSTPGAWALAVLGQALEKRELCGGFELLEIGVDSASAYMPVAVALQPLDTVNAALQGGLDQIDIMHAAANAELRNKRSCRAAAPTRCEACTCAIKRLRLCSFLCACGGDCQRAADLIAGWTVQVLSKRCPPVRTTQAPPPPE